MDDIGESHGKSVGGRLSRGGRRFVRGASDRPPFVNHVLVVVDDRLERLYFDNDTMVNETLPTRWPTTRPLVATGNPLRPVVVDEASPYSAALPIFRDDDEEAGRPKVLDMAFAVE